MKILKITGFNHESLSLYIGRTQACEHCSNNSDVYISSVWIPERMDINAFKTQTWYSEWPVDRGGTTEKEWPDDKGITEKGCDNKLDLNYA